MNRSFLFWCFTFALSGCSGEPEVTYHGTTRAIMETRCVTCHSDEGLTPFPLENWEQVQPVLDLVTTSIENRTMPPWGMNADCRDLQGSIDLTNEERESFRVWAEADYPEGNPQDYTAPVRVEPFDPGLPDLTLQNDVGYLPPKDAVDDYRCLLLDTAFETDTFIAGSRVLPDRLDLVHHIIVYLAPEHRRETLEAMDAEDEEPGFTCFGDAGIQDAQMLTGWAPGGSMLPFDGKSAMRVPAGSIPIMQMHYNRTEPASAEELPDRSKVELWTLADGDYPDNLLHLLPVADLGISIEAGAPDSTHIKDFYYPVDAEIVGVAPHMHLLGSQLYASLHRPDGRTECLAAVDQWDFNWQRSYVYEEEARVPFSVADRIELTCVFDNSAENQAVQNGEKLDPQEVRWGDGSHDEMCLNYLLVQNPYYGAGESGVCAGFQTCLTDCPDGDAFCALSCMSAAGEACMYCGIDGLFGDCLISSCQTEAITLGACFQSCPQDYGEDIGCLYTDCNEEMNSYYSCIEPAILDGSCAEDFTGCDGISERP
jgi:hypothetical protein